MRTYPASSRAVGGCNNCTRHISAKGGVNHIVTVVDLRNLSFRLCKDCRDQLLDRLQRELLIDQSDPAAVVEGSE